MPGGAATCAAGARALRPPAAVGRFIAACGLRRAGLIVHTNRILGVRGALQHFARGAAQHLL